MQDFTSFGILGWLVGSVLTVCKFDGLCGGLPRFDGLELCWRVTEMVMCWTLMNSCIVCGKFMPRG